jgi:SynChlorMet cassette protein ScmC
MIHFPDQELLHTLELADGYHWWITAGDAEAADLVSRLGRAMQLPMTADVREPFQNDSLRRISVRTEAHVSVPNLQLPPASHGNDVALCIPNPDNRASILFVNLMRLSLALAREVQSRGGLLIHGALAELDGSGVILAAPGGTGKSTASSRLPYPWRSLCDDTTLIVRDRHGDYRAHPWPTWSRFLDGGTGGVWNVQRSVALKGIFFLARAGKDRVELVGHAQAAGLLAESVRQASMFMVPDGIIDRIRDLHLERFENICALARVVPVHLLHISLTGSFWLEIEQTLEASCQLTDPRRRNICQPDGIPAPSIALIN